MNPHNRPTKRQRLQQQGRHQQGQQRHQQQQHQQQQHQQQQHQRRQQLPNGRTRKVNWDPRVLFFVIFLNVFTPN